MNISEKRLYVQKLHRSVNKKVSRNKGKGVLLSGTEFDPRRDLSKVKRYTNKQLDAYAAELAGFTSRKTQFAPDAFGRAMPASEFRGYKGLETENKRQANAAFDKVAHLFNPTSGMTLKQRMDKMMPDRITSSNRRVNAAYQPDGLERESTSITSRKSLEVLTKAMKNRVAPGKQEKDLKQARRSFMKMLKGMNDVTIRGNKALGVEHQQSLQNLAKTLTQDQFNVIWQYTTLPDMADYNYQSAEDEFGDRRGKGSLLGIEHVMNDNRQQIRDVLQWGKSVKFADKPSNFNDPKFAKDSNTIYR